MLNARATFSLLFWLTFLGGVTWFFHSLLSQINNPNQVVLIQQGEDQSTQVVLKRNRSGHYIANGKINGQDVTFFLDTGASHISIPIQVAKRLKLRKGLELQVNTANGVAAVYATKIDSISLGNIQSSRVMAHVNPNMQGEEVLLGMTFLKHLEMTQRGDTLSLRVPSQP